HGRLWRRDRRPYGRARLGLAAGPDRSGHRVRHGHSAAAPGAALPALGGPHRGRSTPGLPVRLKPWEAAMRQFLLPDLGEGLDEAEIVAWHVTEGDHVVADQPLVSVETDKAVVEVPSPWSGRIARLCGAKGDLVQVGAPLVEFAEGLEEDKGTVVGELGHEPPRREAPLPPIEPTQAGRPQVLPAVRALARKLDVDLNLVQGSGPDGTITRADVERAAKSLTDMSPAEPLRGMRRAMAQRMAAAHAEVVPASVTDEA